MKHPVLVMNVGSPTAPTPSAVRAYLAEFLYDRRVIDLPAWQRWLLLNFVILPFRPQKSAHAYQAIWRPEGSPLVYFSERQRSALEARLQRPVLLGMAFGKPSLVEALRQLKNVERLSLLPMFPHYASATTGAVLEKAYATLGERTVVPALEVVRPFWSMKGYLDALAGQIRATLGEAKHLLLSYHGLPERQVKAVDSGCLESADCCARLPAGCYRAQCLATSKALGQRLPGLTVTSAFQSRLGKERWLGPSSEEAVLELARQGVKHLAVACPSFVADCLETLEEIGLRLKETFLGAGGQSFNLAPCVNDDAGFIEALASRIEGSEEA